MGDYQSGTKFVQIREQTIDDAEVSGLTLVFSVAPSGDEFRLQIIGDSLLFGNRDFQFDKDGQFVGTGVALGHCKP